MADPVQDETSDSKLSCQFLTSCMSVQGTLGFIFAESFSTTSTNNIIQFIDSRS